jgi:hypothetical protein
MRITELFEGGWDTTKTQQTVLHPKIVSVALKVVDQFVSDFNNYLKKQNIPPVKRGKPTGSSAYHEQDSVERPDVIYGDIDLQMIGNPVEGLTYGQFTSYWNDLADKFVTTIHPQYVDTSESKPGHPIFQVGQDQYVQVDFMWHEEKMAEWGAARVTPERGMKGLLMGNMFSVLGELLNMSIQHAGVQLKTVNGQQVPFSKQKDVEVQTVSINPRSFVYDIFKYLHQQILGTPAKQVDPLLKQFPGNNIDDVKIATMVNAVKGFARSCELNQMFGQGALEPYASADDFLQKFLARYDEKAQIDIAGKKRDKATTPEAIARANADREKIQGGLDIVKGLF